METRHRILFPGPEKLAGEEGLEPSLRDPESRVLPLDYSPATVTKAKSGCFVRPGNGIIPPILLQKAAGIRQQIQSLLSNPLRCLEPLCNPKYKSSAQKCQLLPAKADAAGILFASPMRGRENILADNGKETIPLAAPPTLRDIRRSADETDTIIASLTLPDFVTEVASC